MKKYFILLSLALLATAFNAYSATLQVINENDSGTGSLRERIASANSGDTIIFAPNVNYITLTRGQIYIIDKNLTISGGSGNTRVTIKGNNMIDGNNHGIFFILSLLLGIDDIFTTNINNLILTTANDNDDSAVMLYNAGLIATDCIFTENSTRYGGGAVYLVGFSNHDFIYRTVFTAINCTFNKNSAMGVGGAVLVNGAIFTAINCTFNKNSAMASGGAIDINNAQTYLYHCTFDENQASNGNAITMNNNVALYSYNCVYTGNTPQIVGNIMDGDNLIEGVNAIVTRNYVFGTNQFNGRYITPLPNARAAKKLDNTIQVPAGMSVDEILNKLAKDQRGNPRPTD